LVQGEAMYVTAGLCREAVRNVAHGRKARLDSGALGMHASLNDPAYARNQVDRGRDSNNACGRANNVHHVIGAATSSDGVPVSIEGANRDRNVRFESKSFR